MFRTSLAGVATSLLVSCGGNVTPDVVASGGEGGRTAVEDAGARPTNLDAGEVDADSATAGPESYCWNVLIDGMGAECFCYFYDSQDCPFGGGEGWFQSREECLAAYHGWSAEDQLRAERLVGWCGCIACSEAVCVSLTGPPFGAQSDGGS